MRYLTRLSLLLFLGLVAACNSGTPENTQQQILQRGNGPVPETLDPHRSRSDSAANVLRDLYEGLVGETPTGELTPGVAKSWTISDDGTVYTFHLRDNARWSNGDPLTAQDFVAGLRRSINPATASHYASVLYPIKNARAVHTGEKPVEALGVTALDEHTLQITLNTPTPYFLGLLTHHSTYPIHPPSLEKYGERFTRPGNLVSNGAFMLADRVMQSNILLRKNPYYWNADSVALDGVRYWHIPDESAELKRYRAGDLDVTYTIPGQQYAWLKKNLGDQLRIAPYLSTYFYGFNLTQSPFKDAPKLRRALSMTVERDIIAKKILGQGQLPAWGFVPPGINGYKTRSFEYADWPREKRVAVAQRLYKEAGYGPNNPLQVEIRYNSGEVHERIASAIAAMWREALGVQTTQVSEEFRVFLQNRQQMEVTEIFRSGWVADYNDATTFLDLFRGGSTINDTGYDNPAYNALLEAAAKEADAAKRQQLLQQAESMLLHDHVVLPLYFYVSRHLVKPDVEGWTAHPLDRHYSMHLSLQSKEQAGQN